MAYAEQILPSRSKPRTSRGATTALRRSRGQSAAPRVAPSSPSAPSRTSVARTRSAARSATKALRKARRQEVRQAKRTIQRAIDSSEPVRASKAIESRVKDIVSPKDQAKPVLLAPKLQTPVKVAKKTIKVSPEAAKVAMGVEGPSHAKQTPTKYAGTVVGKPPKAVKREVKTKLKKAAKKSQGGLARKLDRAFGPNETITPRQAAIVAESEGLPGVTYAKAIAPGESGLRPGVPNPDDGYPSLFQMTPSVQSEETRAKWDRIAAKRPGGPSNPIVAAKQAKVLAGDSADEGVSNYYGFDPSAPQGHLPGGQKAARKALYGKREPIPTPLKQKAKQVLGKKQTRKVIEKARRPEAPVPKKLSGPYDGSREMVRKVLGGVKVRGDHTGTVHGEGEDVHSEGGFHEAPNAYAQDLGSAGPNAAEREPTSGYSQKTMDMVAKNLRKLGFPDVPDFKVGAGQTYRGSASGYEAEVLDELDHFHVGMKWVGEGAATPATTGGVTSSPASASPAPVTGVPTPSKTPQKRSKARRQKGRERSRLLRELIAKGPVATAEPTSSSRTSYAQYASEREAEVF